MKQSLDILSDDASCHYYLALQYADIRELQEALTHAKQAVSLDSSLISAWHLLALLMSAQKQHQQTQKQHQQAIQLCNMAIRSSEWEVGSDGSGEAQGEAKEGEEILQVLITKAMLQDAINGAEAGLKCHGTLFTFYSRVFAGDGLGASAGLGIELMTKANAKISYANGNASARSTFTGYAATVAKTTATSKAKSTTGASLHTASVKSVSIRLELPTYTSSVASAPKKSLMESSPVGSSLSSYSPPSKITLRVQLRRQRALQALTDLWLLAANTFRRLGRYEEAWLAVEEAEGADEGSADASCHVSLFINRKGWSAACSGWKVGDGCNFLY